MKTHDPNLTKIKRKSAAVKARIEFCFMNMRQVDIFVQTVVFKLEAREKQVDALMAENAMLREKLKMKPRKTPPADIPFVFPRLSDNPEKVLDRKVEELLPIPERLDEQWRSCRTRIIKVSRSANWHTVRHLLWGDRGIEGPSWFGILRYRNLGEMGLRMVAATFNHFGVDQKNVGLKPADPKS